MRIRRRTLLVLVSPFVLAVAAAYVQWATVGLPAVAPAPTPTAGMATEPHGFPGWLRVTHYVNFFFLILLVRSGL
jgi:methionine sulfoxide reductase catalytic subunit